MKEFAVLLSRVAPHVIRNIPLHIGDLRAKEHKSNNLMKVDVIRSHLAKTKKSIKLSDGKFDSSYRTYVTVNTFLLKFLTTSKQRMRSLSFSKLSSVDSRQKL
ncbi:hypothetical protein TNCV_300771 [Trichonephila clavipes]|nr:hypothetical protein TNCV_300771 [Trichonephila clavipes]